MILQGINEMIGGVKDKKQGAKDLNAIEGQRGALTPKISTIALFKQKKAYDISMINMMQNSQAQRQANQMGAAGRNPLAAARVSSANSAEGVQSDMNLLKFMDQKRSGARENFRKEEVSVMDKKWSDFLGRRGEAKDLIQQGKQRASQGLGSIDSAITSVVTMGMSSAGSAAIPTPSPGDNITGSPGKTNQPVDVDGDGIDDNTGQPV